MTLWTPVRLRLPALVVGVSLVAGSAVGSDGVLEVNQACAVQTGCFPGDTPGFPVTLTAAAPARSVRLTGDLTVATGAQTVINVSANGATVDLGGFRILGPAVCTGVPVTSCTNTGVGVGVVGLSDVTVRNGAITGMGDDGVRLDFSGRVEALHVFSNGGDGIVVGNESIVWRNVVTSNDGRGIVCLDRCVVNDNTATGNGQNGASLGLRAAYGGNVFSLNGLADVSGGHASSGNQCADRSCSSRGARRFYMTQTGFNGAQALTACATGFHMASMWEIQDPSGLDYDVLRGQTSADSGFGPPRTVHGYVRTGGVAESGLLSPGADNCSAWSSTSGTGTIVQLAVNWSNAPTTRVESWDVAVASCTAAARVWCVED